MGGECDVWSGWWTGDVADGWELPVWSGWGVGDVADGWELLVWSGWSVGDVAQGRELLVRSGLADWTTRLRVEIAGQTRAATAPLGIGGAAMSERRRVVQRGLWFEEFEVGVVYEHRPGRTLTEADNVLFTTLTMNTQPLHLDAYASEHQPPFHERLVNSMLTLSTLVGLSVAQLTQGTIVANLGFTEVSFPAPVRLGDTIYAETLVMDKRPSASRPGEGIVTLEHVARNQHGAVVAKATRSTLVRLRPAAEPTMDSFIPDVGENSIHKAPADQAGRDD